MTEFVECTADAERRTLANCYFNLGVFLLKHEEKLSEKTGHEAEEMVENLEKAREIKLSTGLTADDPEITEVDQFLEQANQAKTA